MNANQTNNQAVSEEQAFEIFNKLSQASKFELKSPYIEVLEKGTLPEMTAAALTAVCSGGNNEEDSNHLPIDPDTTPESPDKPVTNQYSYLSVVRHGSSEEVTTENGFLPFASGLNCSFSSAKQLVSESVQRCIRGELFKRSGVKIVVNSGNHLACVYGGYNQIDVPTPTIKSDGRITAEFLQKTCKFARDVLKFRTFGEGLDEHLILIGDYEIIDQLLSDSGRKRHTSKIDTEGNVGTEQDFLDSIVSTNPGPAGPVGPVPIHKFIELVPGIKLGLECSAMRAEMTSKGYKFIDPELVLPSESGDGRYVSVPNAEWDDGTYSVAFLFGKGSFERQTPENAPSGVEFVLSGDGKPNSDEPFSEEKDATKFKICWKYIQALRPIYPWFCVPIIYKREFEKL